MIVCSLTLVCFQVPVSVHSRTSQSHRQDPKLQPPMYCIENDTFHLTRTQPSEFDELLQEVCSQGMQKVRTRSVSSLFAHTFSSYSG